MSFNTFCGQDPANAATYNKVLLRFQEGGGGGGGVATVNATPFANITVDNFDPANPTIGVSVPLNANLDLGPVDIVDSGGFIGAAGTVLSSNGVGAGTSWIAAVPAGNVVVPNDNTNVNRYLTFVAATGGVQQIYADSGAGAVSVNPNQGDFNVVDTLKITQDTVAVGKNAGSVGQGIQSVAIGLTAGQTNQGVDSVAIGETAGQTTQGVSSVAIGERAGQTNQGNSSVAIGTNAGLQTQGGSSVAIGPAAAQFNQGLNATAVGNGAGNVGQGIQTVAVGISAGQTNQGAFAVAIGSAAGQSGQGANAVAIGQEAGSVNQTANSICINATGAAVQTTTAGLYIDPIVAGPAIANPVPAATQFLTYDTATKEITYRDGAGIGGGGGASYPLIVPLYRQLQPAPQTAVAITSGVPCELTAGGLVATVAQIYDPVAAAALGLSTVVQVEYWYSAGFANGSNQMIFPAFPNNLPVNDITPGTGPIGLFYAPKYIPSTTGVRTSYIGNQGCYSSSVLLGIPPVLAGERGFSAPNTNLQTQTSIIVALDVAGLAPADTITFVLDAYTQYPWQVLETTLPYPQVEYFGQISITTSMTRA